MKCNVIGPMLLGAVCAAVLASCGKPDKPGAARGPEGPARQVQVARAELRPMEHVIPVVGALMAYDQATVAAQVAGQIERTHVELGDRVVAGQELASIDTTAYEALADQAAANVARAMASASNAVQELKRFQQLQQDEISSTSELDQAIANAERTRAEVKAAEAANAIARLNLERSRVKAPFDGAIAERVAGVGDYVAVGAPIARLVKTDPLRLRLEVPERESILVSVGQAVRLRIEGDTNVYSGRIARLSPAITEDNRMLIIEGDVPRTGALRPGLFARGEIVINEQENVLSVPDSALITFAGLEKVVVAKDGKAVEKTVTTGRRSLGWTEILNGLQSGETVVLEPAGLRTGQPLAIAGEKQSRLATGLADEPSKTP